MEDAKATTSSMVLDVTVTGPLDWEAKREKITRLYINHSVKQIKEVMKADGFLAR
jgi:Clr5 domain